MANKNAGYLVETATGKKGRTFHCEKLVNGKMVVHLCDEDFNVITGADGKPQKMLVDRAKVKLRGFAD